MRVLIAGVTGYLGSHLAEALADAGHSVEGTSRNPGNRRAIEGVTRMHRWSTDEPLLAEAIAGTDAIVLLTGESVLGRWTAGKKRKLYDSRVGAARNLVRGIAASAHKPSVVVGGSAVGYYGDRGEDLLSEDAPSGTDFLARLTADWEAAIGEVAGLGVRAVHSRTALVLGKRCTFLRPMLPIWRLGLGGRLGSGAQWWPWVHVDDLTGALRHAIETPGLRGAVNVVAPGIVRQREFSKALGRALGRPAFTWAPAFAIRLVLGEMSNEVLTSKRVQPTVLAHEGYQFAYPSVDRALEDAVGR